MMTESCKQYFYYDKSDSLITYIDFNIQDEIVNYYNVNDNELTKINNFSYKEKSKLYKQQQKTKILFAEDISLNHMNFYGESRVVATKKNSNKFIDSPDAVANIHLNNNFVESFSIKANLLEDWMDKL